MNGDRRIAKDHGPRERSPRRELTDKERASLYLLKLDFPDHANILAVLYGAKPLTSFKRRLGEYWPINEQQLKEVAGDTQSLLTSLGVVAEYKIEEDMHRGVGGQIYNIHFVVALSQDNIDLFHANNPEPDTGMFARRIGELFGFPKTAIDAFVHDFPPSGEVPESERQLIQHGAAPKELTGSPCYAFGSFRFSKAHWREELRVACKIRDAVKKLDPNMYRIIVAGSQYGS